MATAHIDRRGLLDASILVANDLAVFTQDEDFELIPKVRVYRIQELGLPRAE
jgi:predicted nucleic acid-binding protein